MLVEVSTWGGRGRGRQISGRSLRVRVTEERSALDAALAQIERRLRLHCACVSPQGTSLDRRGQPESQHFQVTLGHPVPQRYGGGVSVDGELWIAVPVGTGFGEVGYRG